MIDRQKIHKQVIAHFGWSEQMAKATEGLDELKEEIWKYLNSPNNKEELLGELADVLNMTEQLVIITTEELKLFALEDVKNKQNFKMIRTKGLIENE